MRRPRASIRKQLSENKQAQAPKKVEEENLICLYHNADRRRTIAKLHAALPDMDGEMAALARQTLAKLDTMTDTDFEAYQFHFTDE